jgi:hypothetical protein
VPTSSSTDAVTDNGRRIQKDEKMTAASVSDENSAGARPGYAYFANLGPGAHVIQVTGDKK